MPTFSVRDLTSFGNVAAEDEPVLSYFLKTEAVSKIANHHSLLILGRKGSGKTAIVRYFSENAGPDLSTALSMRGYPWKIHATRIDAGGSEVEAYVSSWRYLICMQFAILLVSKLPHHNHPACNAIRQFLTDNYGGVNCQLGDVLRPGSLTISSASLEPEFMGFKLGSISLERKSGDMKLGAELNALSDMLLRATIEAAQAYRITSLQLHFDELDQGLTKLDDGRARMLIGLVLAAREVKRLAANATVKVSPIIYMRSDIWDNLKFSDKNKIDQSSSLYLEWRPDTLSELIKTRLQASLSPEATWENISTGSLMRGSQTQWNHILSRTFLRPRDVISFLNSTLKEAKNRTDDNLLLSSKDITSARERYSPYLKAELDDEIIAHWPEWEEALQACSGISTITFRKQQFIEEYNKRRSSKNNIPAEEGLKLLYNFSVIGYERRSGYGGSSWTFQYTNPEAGWDNQAATFKVHLGLKEYAKLREERGTGNISDE